MGMTKNFKQEIREHRSQKKGASKNFEHKTYVGEKHKRKGKDTKKMPAAKKVRRSTKLIMVDALTDLTSVRDPDPNASDDVAEGEEARGKAAQGKEANENDGKKKMKEMRRRWMRRRTPGSLE